MGIVVFVIGSAAGELDGLLPVDKMSVEVIVEELTSVIAVEAEDGEREVFSMFLICSRTPVSPFPHTARCSVHPVAISTKSMVLANMPAVESPQWATVSASRKPGRASSH